MANVTIQDATIICTREQWIGMLLDMAKCGNVYMLRPNVVIVGKELGRADIASAVRTKPNVK